MADKYAGIPQSTLTDWVTDSDEFKALKPPSGKLFRVTDILASHGNTYSVIEASDLFSLAVELLVNSPAAFPPLKRQPCSSDWALAAAPANAGWWLEATPS
jgi:hypothetical protein